MRKPRNSEETLCCSEAFQGPYTDQPSVMVQPTVYVTSGPLAQPLPDYLGYSIFTMLCCCLPLGVAALVYSINVSDKPVCLCVLSLLHTFTFTPWYFRQLCNDDQCFENCDVDSIHTVWTAAGEETSIYFLIYILYHPQNAYLFVY
uniref:Uncharacterized protein n=1 Tax=Astyanax mexicanus TaxID=7994 RepID=A0A8B9GZG9_ASTMX